MAEAVDLEFDGGAIERYDEVAKLMDYEPGSRPPGCLFRWGATTDRGLRVTDVWETKEQGTAVLPLAELCDRMAALWVERPGRR